MSKTILITGVSRRLGFLLANLYLDNSWNVIGQYRTERDNIKELKSRGAKLFQADFAKSSEIDALAAFVGASSEAVDVIIHNASTFTKDRDAESIDELFTQLFNVHVLAPFKLNEALTSQLEKSESNPCIIHITDIFARNPNPEFTLYCAAKAGLENMTMSFAKKLAPKVRVNSIAPGPVKFLKEHSEEVQQQVLSETLLQKEGGFESIIEAVEFIVQNTYMTGSIVTVDGGRFIT